MKIQIFDPPMCCSTGICGPGVDPALVEFTADLDWLKRQGIEVERYNLSQQTQAFVNTPIVTEALKRDGNDCLPLVLVDGKVVMLGVYPNRSQLVKLTGLEGAKNEPDKASKGLKFTVEAGKPTGSGCCSAPPAEKATSCCEDNSEKKSDKKSSCC